MNEETIDKRLPQTQCGECGFEGCRPYAKALSKGEATINLCPPGGVKTLYDLAELLNEDPTPYEEEVKSNTRPPSLAYINEADCIGCTKCIQACPVDAILGSNKKMHTVIEKECTGCGLCVEPCPVDCITMQPQDTQTFDPETARKRFHARQARLKDEKEKQREVYQKTKTLSHQNDAKAKQDYIQALLKRKKQTQRQSKPIETS